jgi:hypothetical protein
MKAVLRIASIICAAIFVLGIICFAIGLISGGSFSHLMEAVYSNYNVDYYVKAFNDAAQYISAIWNSIF